MESKYYTPSIEEFHVGFEFEYLAPSGEWVPFKCYDETPEGKLDWRALRSKDMKDVRVKYLDRQDIEDLGFNSRVFYEDVNGPSFRFEKDYVHLYYSGEGSHKGYIRIEYNKGTNIFQGVIKNKSELQKLLKQLGIK